MFKSGVTKQDLADNPVLRDYFIANSLWKKAVALSNRTTHPSNIPSKTGPMNRNTKFVNCTRTHEDRATTKKKRGKWFIVPKNRTIECVIDDPETPIPTCLELDCTNVTNENVLRMERIEFPECVRVSAPQVADAIMQQDLYSL